jgi:hypothetical protein
MPRTGSALLVVALCATAVGGIALATTSGPDERAPLAVASGPGSADPAASPPTGTEPQPDFDDLERLHAWQGPVGDVLSDITADFPDDVAGSWFEGDATAVAFSGTAPPEAVERLRALGRPFVVQEGLGFTELELTELSIAVSDRVLELAPGRYIASGASVRDRTFSVDVGAPFDLVKSGGPDLGMDADELEDRIRAGFPAGDLAGFDIVTTIDPSWTTSG